MEMHTSSSLYATHGLIVQSRTRTRLRWVRSLLAMCARKQLAFRRELKIRRAIVSLEQLDDHLLKDIGITRGEIEYAVRQSQSQPGAEDAPC
jgi:uncharacterized protein YjiS (DUF1127 family)